MYQAEYSASVISSGAFEPGADVAETSLGVGAGAFETRDVVGAAVPIKEQLLFEENNNLREMGFLPGISNLIAYPAAWSIREVRQKGFWDAVGHYDPLPYWQEMEIDGLALFGEIDPNVPSIKSAELLRSLGKDNITVKVYGGSAHALQDPVDQGNRYIREDALHDIVTFVKRATATS